MQKHAKRQFNNTIFVNEMAAIAIGAMLLFSVAGIKAFADNVEDDIQVSPPERTITIPGTNADGTLKDASTTVKYWVKENSAGGLQGCDASDGSPVTITFQFPRSAISASSDSLSFSQCGDSSTNTKSVTYTSNKPGDYPISVSAQDSNGRYNTGDATFILHVKPPTPPSDTTNPAISITSPNDGATLTSDSVTVKGTASDSGSGLAKVEVKIDSGSYSAAAGTDPWSFDVTNLSEGSHTITAQATDKAGNTATASIKVTYTPPDTTAPILKLPPDITAEANNADGAEVSYTVTATDDRDPSPTITCTPASGSTFKIGTTPVNCTATDAAGNEAEGSFNVIVQDKTAPVLKLPDADITAEATSAGGAAVTYTATAQDAIDGSVTPLCTPASGSTFKIGTTPVNCTATDAAGNEAEGSFNVIVQDKTAPVLSPSPLTDITVEATSASGNAVTFTPKATDAVDGDVPVICTPASGSTFPLGTTPVNCTATDAAGNEAEGSFNVIVQDTTKPELTLPSSPITQEATSASGNAVTYTATAADNIDGPIAIDCTPASGSTFKIGTTPVNCTATDKAGNEATGTFNVIVQDTTKPVIKVTGTISDGQQFYFGDVPNAPTCTATDSGSGVTSAGCTVSGYGTKVGPQTLTFTATDNEGNTATQTIKYTVLAWTIKGFYQPVDMNGVENAAKGGSTIPLKFEVFKGTTELTATSAIVTPLKATKVTCDGGATIDEIEALATGGTVLRYDSTGGQFIYNWQTPKQPGACYHVTVTTQDGSSIVAEFRLR